MMETLVVKFNLKMFETIDIVNAICMLGYHRTNNKFSVEFNGSKGYMSNIVISCEGNQKERNNIIWIENLRTKGGKFKSKMVEIYHSEENGVRVAVQRVK
jgi:hypothetical protein